MVGLLRKIKTIDFYILKVFTFEKAEELYKRGLKYDVVIHVYTRDAVYAYNLTEDEKRYVQNRQEMIEVFDQNLDFLKGLRNCKSIIYKYRF